MPGLRLLLSGVLLLCSSLGFGQDQVCKTTPNAQDMAYIGDLIYRNECNRDPACLVDWNPGEAFPSLGIGHFIWYPTGVEARFTESFPLFVQYLQQRSVSLPSWLNQLDPLDAPWASRTQLMQQRDNAQVNSLRHFLATHIAEQSAFMLTRLQQAIPQLLIQANASDRIQLQANLRALCQTPLGWYALIDYVNFKGEGLNPRERYNGQGWGLLQVLQTMNHKQPANNAFANAAAKVLTRRANLSQSTTEQRWLQGWLKRVDSYRRQTMLD